MKNFFLLCLFLLTNLIFCQTYSGSVYIIWNDESGLYKYYASYNQNNELVPVLSTGQPDCVSCITYWVPFNTNIYPNAIMKATNAHWIELLAWLDVYAGLDFGLISTYPNNPTLINVGPNSDLLYLLHLSEFGGKWRPQNFNTQFTLVFSLNNLNVNTYNTITNKIYPNPATDIVCFQNNENINYFLYDLQGKLLENGFNNHIDISQYSVGLYFVKFNTEFDLSIVKLLIK